MYNISSLVNFVKENSNWKELLKKPPYSLKCIAQSAYNPDWYMFVYNLFSSDMTNPIVAVCRGSVLEVKDVNGERNVRVICNPYYKFFNYGDPNAANIDWNSAIVESKMDGQLEKMSRIDGKSYWFTNGSFDMGTPIVKEDADKGIHNYRQLLAYALKDKDASFVFNGLDNNDDGTIRFEAESDWTKKVPDGWTLMFELCGPFNPIQVKYEDIKLWFHGARDEKGFEHDPIEVAKMFGIPYEIPERWNLHNIKETMDMLKTFKEDKEGFVVVDKNYDRIKMKSDVYLKMKFAADSNNPKTLFYLTITDGYDDILPSMPEIKPEIDKYLERLGAIRKYITDMYVAARMIYKSYNYNKKDFAIYVAKNVEQWKKPFYFNSIKYDDADKLYFNIIDKWSINSAKNAYNSFIDLEAKLK